MWNEISPPPETKKHGYHTVQLPVRVRKLDTYPVDRVDEYVAYGMAGAFQLIISNWSELGPVPDLFNERIHPLSSDAYASTGFEWTSKNNNAPPPPLERIKSFLVDLVKVLNINAAQLTVAYVICEKILREKASMRTLAQTFSLRPFFIGCCIIAIKVTEDASLSMQDFASSLNVCFPEITARHLYLYESRLLSELKWSIPIDYKSYQTYYEHLIQEASTHTMPPPILPTHIR